MMRPLLTSQASVWMGSQLEFEILHGDPRWEKILTSAGLSKQQLAVIEFEFTLPEQEQSLKSPVSAEKEKNGG